MQNLGPVHHRIYQKVWRDQLASQGLMLTQDYTGCEAALCPAIRHHPLAKFLEHTPVRPCCAAGVANSYKIT